MSKGLEALERIEVDMEYVTRLDFVEPIVRGEVQQDLYRIYHREEKDLDIIKKELQALEIIKKKRVDADLLLMTDNVEDYNKYCSKYINAETQLAKEEFNLVKEVLINESSN